MHKNGLCPECHKTVGRTAHALQCDDCHVWQHIGCAKISTALYKLLCEDVNDHILFRCSTCKRDRVAIMDSGSQDCQRDLLDDDRQSNEIPSTPNKLTGPGEWRLVAPRKKSTCDTSKSFSAPSFKQPNPPLNDGKNRVEDRLKNLERLVSRIAVPTHSTGVKGQPAQRNPAGEQTRRSATFRDLNVICTNVPEVQSASLIDRHAEELIAWHDICSKMGLSIEPKSLTRLYRPQTSPHAGSPRMLRVTLNSSTEVESVLLSSFLLQKASSNIRIFADVPWSQRQANRLDPNCAKASRDKKSVFLHGVPELQSPDEWSKKEHDRAEWSFVQKLIGVRDILTTEVLRIPHSKDFTRQTPRLLKVTLLDESMVNHLLEAWYTMKHVAPPELRIRPFKPNHKPCSVLPAPPSGENSNGNSDIPKN